MFTDIIIDIRLRPGSACAAVGVCARAGRGATPPRAPHAPPVGGGGGVRASSLGLGAAVFPLAALLALDVDDLVAARPE